MGSLVKDREGTIGLITGERNRGQMKHGVMSTHKIYREMCRGKQTLQQD
jgi:hypothetical protein